MAAGAPPPPPRPAPPPPPPPGVVPGWYDDPSDPARWRWWDGQAWTGFVRVAGHRPRLPAWLSLPVLISAVLVAPVLVLALVAAPVPTLLSVPTFLVVLGVFVWFDRLEPEPWAERIHAVLWGATVAVVVAVVVNSLVAVVAGEVVAAVVSAPVVEETMKGLGILVAVRRRSVDSVIDGVVYAGWIAAGFAAVENVQYFTMAASEGLLAEVVVLRGVLSPFAHPLFTVWIGITVGAAVVRGRSPLVGALPGLALAISLHAVWNGSTFLVGGAWWVLALVNALGFLLLFWVTAVVLWRMRLRARTELAAHVPAVAARYGLSAEELATFSDWHRTLAVRRSLPRRQRAAFDARHAAVARLAALFRRRTAPDPVYERQLVASLWEARAAG